MTNDEDKMRVSLPSQFKYSKNDFKRMNSVNCISSVSEFADWRYKTAIKELYQNLEATSLENLQKWQQLKWIAHTTRKEKDMIKL